MSLANSRRRLASLARRDRQPELMDQLGLDPESHRRALAALARINRLSGSSGIFWPALRKLARERPGKTVRVLDVACGGGDVTLALARRARRAGFAMEIAGCDLSETALEVARQRAAADGEPVEFLQLDVLDAPHQQNPIPPGFDAIICSLFLHHLEPLDAQRLLRRMAEATSRLILINDLIRSRRGYLLAVAASQLLTRSHIVHVDGPRSVAGAFTPEEALELAAAAGCTGATASRHWPCRYLLQWWKPW